MKHFLSLSLSLFLLAAFAMQAPPKVPDGVRPARMEGKVTTLSGDPVSGAEVRLRQLSAALQSVGDPYVTFSDEQGRFVIEGIAPMPRYGLVVQKNGYSNGRYGKDLNSNAIVAIPIGEGEALTNFSVKMDPQGVVTGRVVDPAGRPVANTEVYLLRNAYSPNGAARRLAVSVTSQTNDKGEFRFWGLDPGRILLLVQSNRKLGDRLISLPTYYPNTTDMKSAVPIEVRTGLETAGLEIRMLQGRGYTVRGKLAIVGWTGATMIQAMLETTANDNGALYFQSYNVRANPDGSFELHNVIPGSYVAVAVVQQNNDRRIVGTGSFRVFDDDVMNVVLHPFVTYTVSGKVTVQGSTVAKLSEASAALSVNERPAYETNGTSGLRMTLNPLDSGARTGSVSAMVKPDGTFTMENVFPGRYYLNRPGTPDTYIKTLQWAGHDVTSTTLDIQSSEVLDVVFRPGAARITGVLRDRKGEEVAGAFIVMWPINPQPALVYQGARANSSDSKGAFTLVAVTPGSYYVAALQGVNGNTALIRDMLEQFNGIARKVEVKENTPVTIDPVLISPEQVQQALEKLP